MTLKKCPKCGGELVVDTIREEVDLFCLQCRRGWKEQADGTWHSCFTAYLEIANAQGEHIDTVIPKDD